MRGRGRGSGGGILLLSICPSVCPSFRPSVQTIFLENGFGQFLVYALLTVTGSASRYVQINRVKGVSVRRGREKTVLVGIRLISSTAISIIAENVGINVISMARVSKLK